MGIPKKLRSAALVVHGFGLVFGAATLLADEPVSTLPEMPDGWKLEGQAAKGQERFLKSCSLCHGENGNGKGRLRLDPPARDLRDADARLMADDWGTFVVVRDGGKAVGLSSRMLGFDKLLDEESLHDVVAFVQSLKDDGASAED